MTHVHVEPLGEGLPPGKGINVPLPGGGHQHRMQYAAHSLELWLNGAEWIGLYIKSKVDRVKSLLSVGLEL